MASCVELNNNLNNQKMTLEEKYKKETGKNIITTLENTELFYKEDYVEWFEKQLTISQVVGRSEKLCNCDFFIEQGYEHSISEKRKNKCEGCNKPIT